MARKKNLKVGGITGADDQVEEVVIKKPAGVISSAARSTTGKELGAWAFMIGFLIAIIAGILAGLQAVGVDVGLNMSTNGLLIGVLAVIGLIVGIVNVSDKEAVNFLIGAIAITTASGAMGVLQSISNIAAQLSAIAVFIGVLMNMVSYFVGPAAIIVALKVIYSTARKA